MKTVVKSSGFPSLRSMMEDFWNVDGFFSRPVFGNELLPAVNIKSKKEHYELEVAAPGFQKKDFNVTMENGLLSISAETSSESEENTEDYTRREFSTSSFTRSFNLPPDISRDQVRANYKDGLLHISIKKSGDGKESPKKIEIT